MNRPVSEEKIIRDFKKIADFSLPSETVEQDLADLRRRLESQDLSQTAAGRKVWRMIMENKAAKYVSAAMVFIGIFIGMHFLPAGELNAAELLTRVSENLKNYPLVKLVVENYRPDQQEPVSVDVGYCDYGNKQVFWTFDGKYIHRMDYVNWIWKIYRPEDNTLLLKDLHGEWNEEDSQLAEYITRLRTEGLTISKSEVVENNRSLTVIEYEEALNNISPMPDQFMSKMMMGTRFVKKIQTRLTVDSDRLFLATVETAYFDFADHLILRKKETSEPVDRVPADIYELGVPADANVVNKVRDEKVRKIRETIDQKQDTFLSQYLAVQLENNVRDDKESLVEAMVIYADGKKLRVDVFGKKYSDLAQAPEKISALAKNSHDLLQPYLPNGEELHLRSIRIYDGLWQHNLDYSEQKYLLQTPQRRPNGDVYGDDDIADFGWRKLGWMEEPERMMENDFSREHNLIGMELTVQSQFGHLPKRLALYVDPAKDYLCRRYVEEELADAPWQTDKTWLNEESRDRLTENVRIYDVTEYAQTSTGQWYPKVTTITGYNRPLRENGRKTDYNRVSRIWLLKENPDFPQALFDPSILHNPEVLEQE